MNSNFGGGFLAATITVSKMCGNDGIGGRNTGSPVKTLAKAKALAQSGDTILVIDGTFTENDLLKDGVNWHFLPGVIVQWTATGTGNVVTNYGIFDDRAGAVSCKITGKGTFKYVFSETDANSMGLLVLTFGSGGRIHFEAARLEISLGLGGNSQAALWIENCEMCHVDVDELVDLEFSGGVNDCAGIYWQGGLLRGRVGFMQVASYCLYSHGSGASNTSGYLRGDYWESNTNAFYQATDAPNTNFRTWLEVLEIKSVINPVGVYGGRAYITAQKIWTPTAAQTCLTLETSGELWLNCQKLSHNGKGIAALATWTGKFYGNVLHFEDLGSATEHLHLNGTGQFFISGETMLLTAGQCVETLGAGAWHIRGYRMEVTTDGAGNDCILVTNTGLVIKQLTMICGASAQCVDAAAARTITNYGSVAKRAKGANVTVNVEAILVDANVV